MSSLSSSKNFKEGFFLILLLLLPFFPYILTVWKLNYISYNNSSDTFLYLDIAKNILAGRGLVTSFNVYQYWPGIFYPVLPFIHVGLSFILAAFYFLFPSVKALIMSNFLVAFLNSYLIFLIAKKLYQDRIIAYWAAFLIAATVSMEITVLRILTEQLSLLVTLPAIWIFLKEEYPAAKRIAWVSFLLGFGVFIRSAAIFYPIAFFLAILSSRGDEKHKTKEAFLILAWPLAIIAGYELFIYLRFNTFFPQYPEAFKNYYLAVTTGGQFFPETPVVRPFLADLNINYSSVNIVEMGRVVFCILRALIIFSFFRFFNIFKEKNRGELLLFWLLLLQVSSTIFFYPYMRIGEFQWTRFLLLPVIALVVFGIKALKDFSQRFFPRAKFFFFHSFLSIIFLSNFYQSYKVIEFYWQEEKKGEKARELTSALDWVKKNTKESDLIAVSEYIIGGVYLERPTVVLPLYNALNQKNLEDFVSIFKPRAVICEKTLQIGPELEALGYRKVQNWPKDSLLEVFEFPLT